MLLRPWHLVVLAAPLLWVVLAIVHPDEEGALYEGIADRRTSGSSSTSASSSSRPHRPQAFWMLLDGIQSVAAKVARVALVFWMVFFSAFDAIAGNRDPASSRAMRTASPVRNGTP
jgi:hypothetical protein